MSPQPQAFEFTVGSGLIYPTRQCQSSACREARSFIRYSIKQARHTAIERSVEKILDVVSSSDQRFQRMLDQAEILLPVPGSAPLVKDGLWVPLLIAQELHSHGIGKEVRPLLSRSRRITQSSATKVSEDRPDPKEHAETLECKEELLTGKRLLLVDDIVTRGSTMAGCVLRLREHYPGIEIEGFALGRVATIELQTSAEMLSPKVEIVEYNPYGSPILVRS